MTETLEQPFEKKLAKNETIEEFINQEFNDINEELSNNSYYSVEDALNDTKQLILEAVAMKEKEILELAGKEAMRQIAEAEQRGYAEGLLEARKDVERLEKENASLKNLDKDSFEKNCSQCKSKPASICWLCSDKMQGLALLAGEEKGRQEQKQKNFNEIGKERIEAVKIYIEQIQPKLIEKAHEEGRIEGIKQMQGGYAEGYKKGY